MPGPVILVARNDDAFSASLRAAGFEVLNLELITTTPVDDLAPLREIIADLDIYDGLFFTSPVAAQVFVDELIVEKRSFAGTIYVLGARTNGVFENAGYEVAFCTSANTARDLIASFDAAEFNGKRLLWVRGDKSIGTITELLNPRAMVDEIVVYDTRSVKIEANTRENLAAQLRNGEIDWICFFSPSAVDSFAEAFGPPDIAETSAAAIGSTTAHRARLAGLRVGFVSESATAGAFADGLIEHIKNIA